MNPALKLDTRQTQTLTPRLQYAVRLLQLSSLDYQQELHAVSNRNPFLEVSDPEVADTDGEPVSSDADESPPVDEPMDDFADVADVADNGDPERDAWLQSSAGIRNGASNGTMPDAADSMVAQPGLREHLHGQANLLPLSPRDHALVCAVIESLDDDGYLRSSLDEIATFGALEPAVEPCELSTALKLVQSFDPSGVGARDIGECLALQLDAIVPEQRALAERIVREHLPRLAQRDVAGLSRLLGKTAAEIDAACDSIRRLDPRPGWRFGRSEAQYIVPDVIVKKSRGKWSAQLNPAVVPRLCLNQTYADLFQRHRKSSNGELAAHLQEARWAVRNVEQRFSTILQVAESILERQYGFFEHGVLAMKPLSLREVADEVGIHESTVCRVTNNKYMATPAGVFELKHFFSRPMTMASGKACSAAAIRGVIQELIAAEDATKPLSDVDIAHRLTRQGLTVARRTITKYRQMLRVPPVERRRRLGPELRAA